MVFLLSRNNILLFIFILTLIIFALLFTSRILLLKSASRAHYKNQFKNNYENFQALSVYRGQVAPANFLTSEEIQDRDSNILRNIRFQDATPPSLQAELDYYQMTQILEKVRDMKIPLLSTPDEKLDKEILADQTPSSIINTSWWMAVLTLFTTILNKEILDRKYYQPYHPYKILIIKNVKIINFNWSNKNIVAELNMDRDGYQNFNIQLDITLVRGSDNIWRINFNSLEIVGLPSQKNISGVYNSGEISSEEVKKVDNYRKFITSELNDSDPKYFDYKYQADKIQEKRYEIAKDALYQASKCFGLINGKSENLNYDNKLFCESYHADINQVGVWDSPCQVDGDCPFYQANKNYPNTFGKCDLESGKCQMPNGIIPLGYKRYGKANGMRGEPLCYNCLGDNDKCCGVQAGIVNSLQNMSKEEKNRLLSPDYVFEDDMRVRKMHNEEMLARGLKPEASLI